MVAFCVIGFFVLVLLGVPLCFSFGGICAAFIELTTPASVMAIPSRLFNGSNSFVLLALPMFILAGELMNRGGLSRRIVDFCLLLVRPFRGGLAEVNVLASIVFGGITGSSVADTTALGGILIPAMEKEGYPTDFSAGVTVASSTIGMVIPPSIPMLIYAVIANESVATLFLSTAVPGLMIGILQTIVVYFISKKKGYHPVYEKKLSGKEILHIFNQCILAAIMPILIIGSISFGICTATESASMAVLYSIIVGGFVYKELKWKDIIPALKSTLLTTASVMLIVSFATVFTWIMAILGIPSLVGSFFANLAAPRWAIILFFNLIILTIGTFLDVTPALLLLCPILIPVMKNIGIGAVQFGAMMIVGLAISLVTPPVALCLNACSKICGLKMGRIFKSALPLLIVNVVVFALVSFVPQISLWLPGLIK